MLKNGTEKDKMLSGAPYFPDDPTLKEERLTAKDLCFDFNQTRPSQKADRQALLQKLLSHSKNPDINSPFHCDYGYNIITGKNFYANHGCTILDGAPVVIGDNVLLAPGVQISTATHPLDPAARRTGIEQALPITIGNDVWIGMGAQILPGVIIGDNVVVAAGAVVNKNVPANTVVAGVPAKVVKTLDIKEE